MPLALACLFLVRDAGRLSAPFGPSHDGFNAALYLTGGRALLEEGPLASRLGAASRTIGGDRVVYAHHPPLIYLADAAALALPGPVEVAARLPAVVASLGFIALLALVIGACGLPAGTAAAALAFTCATPMFLLFGATTEPHILGLTFSAALACVWQEMRRGRRVPVWSMGALAAVGALTSWQAALFAMAVAGALVALERRPRAAAAVAAGAAIGCLLTGMWMLWAYDGDLREFGVRALHRAGAGSGRVAAADVVRRQAEYLADLFPAGGAFVIAIAGAGLVDSRTRPVVAVSLGTVLAYAAIFRNGAYDHNYWLYGVLFPLALGAAVVADAAHRLWRLHEDAGPRGAIVRATLLAAGLVVMGALGLGLFSPTGEDWQRRHAAALGADARALSWPAGQRYAFHQFGGRGPTDLLPWLRFYSRREPFGVEGPDAVPRGEIVLHVVDGRLVSAGGLQQAQP